MERLSNNSFCGSKDLECSCWAILVRLINGWILANPNCYPRARMVLRILNQSSTQVIHDVVLITIWGRWSLIDILFVSHKENCVCKRSNAFDGCSSTVVSLSSAYHAAVALPSSPLFAILQISTYLYIYVYIYNPSKYIFWGLIAAMNDLSREDVFQVSSWQWRLHIDCVPMAMRAAIKDWFVFRQPSNFLPRDQTPETKAKVKRTKRYQVSFTDITT